MDAAAPGDRQGSHRDGVVFPAETGDHVEPADELGAGGDLGRSRGQLPGDLRKRRHVDVGGQGRAIAVRKTTVATRADVTRARVWLRQRP